MADVFKRLAQTVIGATPVIVYTAPASGTGLIRRGIAVNTSPCDPTWFRLWQGGSGDANMILPQLPIPSCGRAEMTALLMLNCADTIWAQSQFVNAITLTFEGLEIT